jgi:hypothetical protein
MLNFDSDFFAAVQDTAMHLRRWTMGAPKYQEEK